MAARFGKAASAGSSLLAIAAGLGYALYKSIYTGNYPGCTLICNVSNS